MSLTMKSSVPLPRHHLKQIPWRQLTPLHYSPFSHLHILNTIACGWSQKAHTQMLLGPPPRAWTHWEAYTHRTAPQSLRREPAAPLRPQPPNLCFRCMMPTCSATANSIGSDFCLRRRDSDIRILGEVAQMRYHHGQHVVPHRVLWNSGCTAARTVVHSFPLVDIMSDVSASFNFLLLGRTPLCMGGWGSECRIRVHVA